MALDHLARARRCVTAHIDERRRVAKRETGATSKQMGKQMALKMSGILFATTIALGLLGAMVLLMTPGSTKVEAREEVASVCRTIPVSLDEGYSISRIEMRQVCDINR